MTSEDLSPVWPTILIDTLICVKCGPPIVAVMPLSDTEQEQTLDVPLVFHPEEPFLFRMKILYLAGLQPTGPNENTGNCPRSYKHS